MVLLVRRCGDVRAHVRQGHRGGRLQQAGGHEQLPDAQQEPRQARRAPQGDCYAQEEDRPERFRHLEQLRQAHGRRYAELVLPEAEGRREAHQSQVPGGQGRQDFQEGYEDWRRPGASDGCHLRALGVAQGVRQAQC